MPIAALGMMGAGLLRAHGDARRSMNATLSAGIVNAIMDPILIFGVGLGLDGAAYASVLARCAMAITAIVPIIRHYGGFAKIESARFAPTCAPSQRLLSRQSSQISQRPSVTQSSRGPFPLSAIPQLLAMR